MFGCLHCISSQIENDVVQRLSVDAHKGHRRVTETAYVSLSLSLSLALSRSLSLSLPPSLSLSLSLSCLVLSLLGRCLCRPPREPLEVIENPSRPAGLRRVCPLSPGGGAPTGS